jgi:flavin-dependent dehydrogenase
VAAPFVVVGGGPGGAVAAARLAQRGEAVIVLEKEAFPRFRLGESLLPKSLHVLEELGLLDAAQARFLVKKGAQFHDDASSKATRFSFDGAFEHRYDYAFQVPRDDFDALLLARSAELGADVRHGWTVTRALVSAAGGARGVVARDPDGREHTLEARFVIDASGRDALFAHDGRATERLAGLENTAFYTHVRGMRREEGERAGDVHVVLFDGGWHWVIPFKDGRTSVGAVVSRAWIRANGSPDGGGEGDDRTGGPQRMFARAVEASPAMSRLMKGAEALWPARAAADFSYRVGRSYGDGWVAVGDAGGFIDPLFSTGVHIAMWGAYEVVPALLGGTLPAWDARVRAGAAMFLTAVRGFYKGALQPYMFTDNPRTYLRRAITSMLSGDVFGDARWTRDMRERLVTLVDG